MKKLMILGLALLTCGAGFAQMSSVKKAKAKAMNEEAPDYAGARALITPALSNEETKNIADAWYVAGFIDLKEVQAEYLKMQMGQAYDTLKLAYNVIESVPYFVKADSLAKIPNEKNKTNPKITKDVQNALLEYFTEQYSIIGAGQLYSDRKFNDAKAAFQAWLSIPDLAVMQDSKLQAKMPKDSTYYLYLCNMGQCAYMQGDYQEALDIYNGLLGKDCNQVTVYEYLASLYQQKGDNASYEALLRECVKKYPNEPWFIGNLTNFYLLNPDKNGRDQSQKALGLIEKMIETNSTDPQLYFFQGNIYTKLKIFLKAEEAYKKALELKPDNLDYIYALGSMYYDNANYIQELSMNAPDNNAMKKFMAEKKEVQKKCDEYWSQFLEKAPADDARRDETERLLKTVRYQMAH